VHTVVVAFEKRPATHARQLEEPGRLHRPTEHGASTPSRQKDAAMHATHADAPWVGMCVPAVQRVHAVAPLALKERASHGVHEEAPEELK
jgi:hypothetical protein